MLLSHKIKTGVLYPSDSAAPCHEVFGIDAEDVDGGKCGQITDWLGGQLENLLLSLDVYKRQILGGGGSDTLLLPLTRLR